MHRCDGSQADRAATATRTAPRSRTQHARDPRIEGELVPLPPLSDEQRRAALEKAAQTRRARAELKEQLKSGRTTLTKVLDLAGTDEVVGKLRVSVLLQAMPGIGKVKAIKIMDKLKISESRRLRGLGNQQRRALLAEFSPNGR
jgi:hypothetical protein